MNGLPVLSKNYISLPVAEDDGSPSTISNRLRTQVSSLWERRTERSVQLKLAAVFLSILVLLLWLFGGGSGKSASASTVILYAYHETDDARFNAEFFLRHGLHASADFVFIMNGETNFTQSIPRRRNVRVVERPNTCYDLGAFGEVLAADNRRMMRKYNRFILMNASIRGPFLPRWSRECWSDAYLRRVTNKVKLVGATANCEGWGTQREPHIQSMIFATDRKGLEVLMVKNGMDHCPTEYLDAVQIEIGSTRLIMNAGYEVEAMMSQFSTERDFRHCTHGDWLYDGKYFDGNISPFETLFAKTKRGIDDSLLGNLTIFADEAGYTSYDYC